MVAKRALAIQSSPVPGFTITGDKPGTTAYTATCYDQQVVNLAALPFVSMGGSDYSFVHWTVDGVAQPDLQTSLAVLMDADRTVVAVYFRHCTLAVQSTPISSVNVLGEKPGRTSYTVEFEEQKTVTLSALGGVLVGVKSFPFVWWTVDGTPRPLRQTDLEITMDTDHTAVAVYSLYCDVNNDCKVNVLDLILTRNRLGQNPATGDNWKADVDQNGRIDVIDLILVRNNLGMGCP